MNKAIPKKDIPTPAQAERLRGYVAHSPRTVTGAGDATHCVLVRKGWIMQMFAKTFEITGAGRKALLLVD